MNEAQVNELSRDTINQLWRFVYNIALRMLFSPYEAEDAVQDILLKVVDKFPGFQNRSSLKTWVYRIAVNHLIDEKRKTKRNSEIESISFDVFAEEHSIDYNKYASPVADKLELELYIEELKIGCTHAMLQCLDRENRIIFILGTIFVLESTMAARILDLSPEAYRKRLSRVREKMTHFMTDNCGLLNPEAPCSCRRRLGFALKEGRVKKDALLFARQNSEKMHEYRLEMEELDDIAGIYRSHPYYKLPGNLKKAIADILSNKELKLFSAIELS